MNASKSKSTGHSNSNTPSPSPPTSRSHSKSPIPKRKVENKNPEPTTEILNKLESSSSEPPELQSLIHRLQGISISQEESELSQGSVTSQYIPSQLLTRAQNEKLGIPPIEFPLPSCKRVKKTPLESNSKVLSSSSSIPSISLQGHTPASQIQIVIHTGTGATPSSTQSPSTIASLSSTNIPKMAHNQPQMRP